MAAKKNLNNPNKPTTKVRSTKGPASQGSGVSKLEDDKKGKVWTSDGRKSAEKGSYSKALGSTKSTAMRDTKKVVKKGETVAGLDKMTKKGVALGISKNKRFVKKAGK